MGVLKVLGLQLCLLAFIIGAEARLEWAASDTKDTDEEPNSMQNPINFETGYESLHQVEAPEFGLEEKHQDPQDFDIMLMTHRVRRSEDKKKKRRKFQLGAYAALGSIVPPKLKQEPEVVRAKRQLKNTGTPKKPRYQPGKYSHVGRESAPTPVTNAAQQHPYTGSFKEPRLRGKRYSKRCCTDERKRQTEQDQTSTTVCHSLSPSIR
ncbi:hypothetical protein AMEX_G10782 [Astyanax mexicanus]|uniref:Uncharacterized protein n=1 Tax=Astyanax mexicanus TaxID=7994 RepID=A0A8T2LQP4_ASTMX|nr:hypothetical protein AMEX_G10782 [Astyanax mexicanus]